MYIGSFFFLQRLRTKYPASRPASHEVPAPRQVASAEAGRRNFRAFSPLLLLFSFRYPSRLLARGESGTLDLSGSVLRQNTTQYHALHSHGHLEYLLVHHTGPHLQGLGPAPIKLRPMG